MSLLVVKSGFMTTIQDAGRWGYAHIGVPVSGFMDAESAHLANSMVNNARDTALIEIGIGGITLQAQNPCTVAVAGARAECQINKKPVSSDDVMHLNTGDVLSIAPLATGMWTYLACHGGIDVAPVLGSRSTLTVATMGGFKGRRLQKNDVIKLL